MRSFRGKTRQLLPQDQLLGIQLNLEVIGRFGLEDIRGYRLA